MIVDAPETVFPARRLASERACSGEHVDAGMIPEALVLDGDERVDEVGIDAVVGDPPGVAAVRSACRAQRDAVAVLDRQAEGAIARQHCRRDGKCEPDADSNAGDT